MATASLTKMSVPAADNSTPSQGLLMPKLQYRFRVTFTNFGINSATGPITPVSYTHLTLPTNREV